MSAILSFLAVAAGAQDLGPLFAPPTPAEIVAVRADWATRPVDPIGWEIVDESTADGFRWQLVRTTLEGVDVYGVLRFPRAVPAGTPARVLLLHHGGTSGIQYSFVRDFDADHPGGCLADSALVVAPTYRDEAFLGGGGLTVRSSGGDPSPFDYDADDAIALLNAVLANVPEADPVGLTSWGRSRGANVAWHTALRDPRIRRTSAYFAPTDFRRPEIQAECQQAVDTGTPSTDSLAKRVMSFIVEPWLAGTISLSAARHDLLAWSVVPFLDAPLRVQLHHGEDDSLVPVAHALAADSALTAAGAIPPEFEAWLYPEGGHSTSGLTGHATRCEDYLCAPLIRTAVAVPPAPRIAVAPNPFSGTTRLMWDDPAIKNTKSIKCDIINARGRRTTTITLDPESTWDGKDAEGRPAPSGTYFVVPRREGVRAARLTKLK